jgi:hypothetical protein
MRLEWNLDLAAIGELNLLTNWDPTTPVPELLKREGPDQEVQRMLTAFSRGLDEAVSFGTHVLEWTGDVQPEGDELVPPLFLLRHVLELVDGISIQIRHACVDPCETQLRALLEASFGIRFMLQDKSRKRSMAFMVCRVHRRLAVYHSLDVSTDPGRVFARQLKSDVAGLNIRLQDAPRVEPAVKNLESLLARPEYAEVDAEYQRTKKKLKRTPPWYALYDGPTTLEQLAARVNRPATYQVFYRHWSGRTHGTGVVEGRLSPGQDGTGAMIQLRFPIEAQQVTQMALNLALGTYTDFISELAPERKKAYGEWYVGKLRPFFKKLGEKPFLTLSRQSGG